MDAAGGVTGCEFCADGDWEGGVLFPCWSSLLQPACKIAKAINIARNTAVLRQ
ncbi:MAG: hypothetical protein ACXWT4_14760 [Methylobacter sp.]